ncbi:MAG: MFS transporter [Planctomycetota bacterium]
MPVRIQDFFRAPPLPPEARRTYRLHLTYALLDAAAGGILMNALLMATKTFGAADWQLPLRQLYSGIGMIGALYLGSWMAGRRKMPFVFIPGLIGAVCVLTMPQFVDMPFYFLSLLGISAMFEILTRPAVTAIVRVNYPAESRGEATGEVRKWSSLSFVAFSLTSAYVLHRADAYQEGTGGPLGFPPAWLMQWVAVHVVHLLMLLAGVLSLAAFLVFRHIRVDKDMERERRDLRPEIGTSFLEAFRVIARDRRYCRYLLACFVDGFFQMLYFPLLWSFFSGELRFGYVGCTAMMHAIPALVAFAMTGVVGRVIDRSNPWISWAGIRLVWGLDALLLAATPFYARYFPPALFLLPLLGRILRGSVQGGWWIMWWQIGVTHFAPPGEDTSRYMGIMAFLNGAVRMGASVAGMTLAAMSVPTGTLLIVGGLGVIASSFYSLLQWRSERDDRTLATVADFEAAYRHKYTAASYPPGHVDGEGTLGGGSGRHFNDAL